MRDLIVMGLTGALCLLSPFNPRLGIYGYYWFGLMRPDILAWSGPNRYSLFIAICAILSNGMESLSNLAVLLRSSLCRTTLLLTVVLLVSSVLAVSPSLTLEPLNQFLRMLAMALLIPLAIREMKRLEELVVVMAASIGLLAGKFGLAGLLAGGVRFGQGYGGMLSDNNTMALAFVLAIPLCWFSRLLAKPMWAKAGFASLALLSTAAVVFTYSRGGALACAAVVFLLAWRAKHRVLVALLVIGFAIGTVYLVGASFTARISTIASAEEDASAKSRIILSMSAVKLWMHYPVFGVGFGEDNQRALISNYVPPAYAEGYKGKVIHNTYLQMLVDSGILALLLYCWLLFGSIFKLEKAIRRLKARGEPLEAQAIPLALQTALIGFSIGSTFLSRTSFDLFYILVMVAAAWFEIDGSDGAVEGVAVIGAPAAMVSVERIAPAEPATPVEAKPWQARAQHGSRLRMGRERKERP